MRTCLRARIVVSLAAVMMFAAAPASAVVVDGIAAVVNGEIITILELEKAGRLALEERLRDTPAADQDRARREVLKNVLDQMVVMRIQAQRARQLGIGVSSQEIDSAIANIVEQNRLSPEVLDRVLTERGVTREEYRKEIQDQIRLSKLVQQEIRSRVTVTDDEVAAYFREHQKDWSRPEKIRVRHLLVPVPKDAPPESVEEARGKALTILAQVRQGKDFADLARAAAPEGSGSEADALSGEIARGELFPALEAAAFALPVGGVSDPVQSPAGFHIVQVAEKTPAYSPKVEEVRASIEQKIGDQKVRAKFDAWLKKLREDALVEIKY